MAKGKSTRLTWAELNVLCSMRGITTDGFKEDFQRKTFVVRLNESELNSLNTFRHGGTIHIDNGGTFCKYANGDVEARSYSGSFVTIPRDNPNRVARGVSEKKEKKSPKSTHTKGDKSAEEYIRDLEAALDIRKASKAEVYEIKPIHKDGNGQSQSVAIVLLSDVHIEETVTSESVLGYNEYNPEIAKDRLEKFFVNSAKLISHDQRSYSINHVILGCLGDIIGNWIHDELMQTNAMSPLEAITYAKSIILSGMKYWQENVNVEKITFVGVVGNHGRTTKKNQYANATDVSMEYFLYKDLQEMASMIGLSKFDFVIPKSEMAIVTVFGKRLMFAHGSSIHGGTGVGGIMIPIMRWFLRLAPTIKADMAFIGHFHQSMFTKKVCVNGSVKGLDAFAIGKGFDSEAPQQAKLILNEKRGFTSYTPIFLD